MWVSHSAHCEPHFSLHTRVSHPARPRDRVKDFEQGISVSPENRLADDAEIRMATAIDAIDKHNAFRNMLILSALLF